MSRANSLIRALVLELTSGLSARALDTVECDTPARRAMSLIDMSKSTLLWSWAQRRRLACWPRRPNPVFRRHKGRQGLLHTCASIIACPRAVVKRRPIEGIDRLPGVRYNGWHCRVHRIDPSWMRFVQSWCPRSCMDDSGSADRSVESARGARRAPGLSGVLEAGSIPEMAQVEESGCTEDDSASLSTDNGTDR